MFSGSWMSYGRIPRFSHISSMTAKVNEQTEVPKCLDDCCGSSPGIPLQRNIVADSARTHPSVNGENRPVLDVCAGESCHGKQTLDRDRWGIAMFPRSSAGWQLPREFASSTLCHRLPAELAIFLIMIMVRRLRPCIYRWSRTLVRIRVS